MDMKKFTGIEDFYIKFVTEKQLKSDWIWELVSSQFIGCADAADYGWRGEYWGKLMRGACMTYKYSKDEELYKVLEETSRVLLGYADEDGRFSTYTVKTEFNGWDMWSRKYVLLGFIHFHEICKDEALKVQIVEAMKKHLDYIIEHVGKDKLNICETSQNWQGVNSSSILEPVVLFYNLTGEEKYLDFARYIIENGGALEYDIFETAIENKLKPYELPVKKAYELMSCFEGLIEYYKVVKEEKWKFAAENFAKRIIESEITIIGCAGCEHECFNNSVLTQTYTGYDGLMQETCVTVTWMKLCYKLLKLTGNSMYADEIEKSAYNALYGAVNTEMCTNKDYTTYDLSFFRDVQKAHSARFGAQVFDSYSPLRAGKRGMAVGGFRPMRDNSMYTGCCIVIGAAGVALVANAAVESEDNAVTFNLYPAGTYEADSFAAEIRSKYPAEGNVEIVIGNDCEKTLKLRIPQFSKETEITLNGEALSYDVVNGYAIVSRKLNKGDVIKLTFDMNFRMVRGMKNPEDEASEKHVAFIYGPLVLARDEAFTKVGEAVKTGDAISICPIERTDINAMCVMEVDTGAEKLTMIDYASAGKVWGNEIEAWLKEA